MKKFLEDLKVSLKKDEIPYIMILGENSKPKVKQWFGIGNADFNCGAYNGYVAIPPKHPLYGKDYDFVNELEGFEIHGGLTFSGKAKFINENKKRFEIIGDKSLPNNWWVFGFDTLHAGDNPKNWNYHRCILETCKLRYLLYKFKQ